MRGRPACWPGPRRGRPPGPGRPGSACTSGPTSTACGGVDVGRERLTQFLGIGFVQVDLVRLAVESEGDRLRRFRAVDVVGESDHDTLRHEYRSLRATSLRRRALTSGRCRLSGCYLGKVSAIANSFVQCPTLHCEDRLNPPACPSRNRDPGSFPEVFARVITRYRIVTAVTWNPCSFLRIYPRRNFVRVV